MSAGVPHLPHAHLPLKRHPDALLDPAMLPKRSCGTPVELPLHLVPPWDGEPFHAEGRAIIDGSTAGAAATGADAAATAEGMVVQTESAWATVATYAVPKGKVAFIRRWAAQPDELGYLMSGDFPLVQVRLCIAGRPATSVSLNLRGLRGRLDAPFDFVARAQPGETIEVQAMSRDTAMWHLVEAWVAGHLVDTVSWADKASALRSTCP